MTFQIHPLDPAPFAPLFDLNDAELATRRTKRVIADEEYAYPCRVSLADAQIGEELILVNHIHMDKPSPYHASHAVYIRKGARPAQLEPGEVPGMLERRLLSLRGFDAKGFMHEADVIDGTDAQDHLTRLFENPDIAFIDIHHAKPGCFGARATRA